MQFISDFPPIPAVRFSSTFRIEKKVQILQMLDLYPFLRCVGETNARSHRKDYQHDTQMQKLVHRLGAFTIASNCILLALCYLCYKDKLFFQRKQMLNPIAIDPEKRRAHTITYVTETYPI